MRRGVRFVKVSRHFRRSCVLFIAVFSCLSVIAISLVYHFKLTFTGPTGQLDEIFTIIAPWWYRRDTLKLGTCPYTLSFTSIPPRLPDLWLMVSNINGIDISYRPTKAVLNLPKKWTRYPDYTLSDDMLNDLKYWGFDVRLHEEDLGPVMKVMGLDIKDDGNDMILVLDDEQRAFEDIWRLTCELAKKWKAQGEVPNELINFTPIILDNLFGSNGYTLPKIESMYNDIMDIEAMKTSPFGQWEDDLWISCIAEHKYKLGWKLGRNLVTTPLGTPCAVWWRVDFWRIGANAGLHKRIQSQEKKKYRRWLDTVYAQKDWRVCKYGMNVTNKSSTDFQLK